MGLNLGMSHHGFNFHLKEVLFLNNNGVVVIIYVCVFV